MCTTCHRRRSAVSVTQGASSGASAIESTGAGVAAAAAAAADDDDDVKDEDGDDAASKSHSRTVKQRYMHQFICLSVSQWVCLSPCLSEKKNSF